MENAETDLSAGIRLEKPKFFFKRKENVLFVRVLDSIEQKQ